MQSLLSRGYLCIVLVLMTSCMMAVKESRKPALLSESSATTRLELEQAVGNLLNSAPIKLADNVFTESSTVFIERHTINNPAKSLNDRLPAQPIDSFTLFKQQESCFLRHDQSDKFEKLNAIQCVAE